jgi:hypothetical protein
MPALCWPFKLCSCERVGTFESNPHTCRKSSAREYHMNIFFLFLLPHPAQISNSYASKNLTVQNVAYRICSNRKFVQVTFWI